MYGTPVRYPYLPTSSNRYLFIKIKLPFLWEILIANHSVCEHPHCRKEKGNSWRFTLHQTLQANQGKLIPLLLVRLRKPLSGPIALNSSGKKFGSCIQFFGSALDSDWESGFFCSDLTLRSWAPSWRVANFSWSLEILYGGLRSGIRIRIYTKSEKIWILEWNRSESLLKSCGIHRG